MVDKKYYCNTCDKYILNKSSHNKTKLHIRLSLSVVNKYNVDDVPINKIDKVVN